MALENLKIWESFRKTPLTKCSYPGETSPGETGIEMRLRPNSQLDPIAKTDPLVLLLFTGCGCLNVGPSQKTVIIKERSSKELFSVVLLSSLIYSSLLVAAKEDPTSHNLYQGEETTTNLYPSPALLVQGLYPHLLSN